MGRKTHQDGHGSGIQRHKDRKAVWERQEGGREMETGLAADKRAIKDTEMSPTLEP